MQICASKFASTSPSEPLYIAEAYHLVREQMFHYLTSAMVPLGCNGSHCDIAALVEENKIGLSDN